MGPEGEWFVAYANGSWRANGYDEDVGDAIARAQVEGEVRRVLFGEDETYFVAYQ
jgi:hypothetical protein